MAGIKQSVMGTFVGKVGTVTTYNSKAGNIARIRNNATNVGETASRTTKQQLNRVRWANVVNFYKASKDWMRKAYETKKSGQSDYNKMTSVNFPLSTIYLTKDEAAVGACVVEAYQISQGSLTPLLISQHTDHWDTNIQLGSLTIDATTTVAAFSTAVLAANSFLKEGDQISFISYQQYMDDQSIPHVICTPYEIILDTTNTTGLVRSYLPEFCSQSSTDGYLATNQDISKGGFAYVLSRTVNGKTYVSTQQLVVDNSILIKMYEDNAEAAIKSYGVDDTVFLDAGVSESKSATPQTNYISEVVGNLKTVAAGGEAFIMSDVCDSGVFTINTANATKAISVSKVTFTEKEGTSYEVSNNISILTSGFSIPKSVIEAAFDESSSAAYYHAEIVGISVTYNNTKTISATFTEE